MPWGIEATNTTEDSVRISLTPTTPIQSMNAKDLVDELFQVDNDIRWVGVIDERGNILQKVQRPGTQSYTDPNIEERTLKEFPTIMGLFWRDLVGNSGELSSVVVAYSRVYILAFYVGDYLAVLSFKPSGMPKVIPKLEARFGTIFPKDDRESQTT